MLCQLSYGEAMLVDLVCSTSNSLTMCVFICNWIKKRREPRANNVTLKLLRVREDDKPLKKEPFMRRFGRTQGEKTREGVKSVVDLLERMNTVEGEENESGRIPPVCR